MSSLKTKSIENLEEKMRGLDDGSLRRHILESAKSFKTSWIELGRALYSVWKDKMYKEWGFSKFDVYTAREIGIRKHTALKLLRSYYFMEKEEPGYLSQSYMENAQPPAIATYETIDALRLAKNKKWIDRDDYNKLKEEVFVKGKDCREVKRDLTALVRQREELSPEEAYQKRRLATVKRFVSTLKALKKEIEISKLMPAPFIREAEKLIEKLEAQI